jgi:hypothetical protein
MLAWAPLWDRKLTGILQTMALVREKEPNWRRGEFIL